LKKLEYEIDKKDYRSYCIAWREEYGKKINEITVATDGLFELPRKYTPAYDLTDTQFTKLIKSKWFKERVFDNYIWEID
jgi:hypothetical protein